MWKGGNASSVWSRFEPVEAFDQDGPQARNSGEPSQARKRAWSLARSGGSSGGISPDKADLDGVHLQQCFEASDKQSYFQDQRASALELYRRSGGLSCWTIGCYIIIIHNKCFNAGIYICLQSEWAKVAIYICSLYPVPGRTRTAPVPTIALPPAAQDDGTLTGNGPFPSLSGLPTPHLYRQRF